MRTAIKVIHAAWVPVLAALVIGSWSCSKQTESITIGGPVSDAAALVFVAEDRGLFAAHGINLTTRAYDTGLAAINGLLNKEIDIAGTAEYPFVVKAFESDKVSIIGSFSRTYNEYLVARADRGIGKVADIKGKRIGLPRRTLPEFYLGRFLDLHGMSIDDVALVDLSPAHAVAAIAAGDIEAAVVWEPFVSQVTEQQTNGMERWSVHSGQASYAILVCRKDWIRQHPELVKGVLNSLALAEEYVVLHPAEAKAILRKNYQYDQAYIDRIWPEHQFSLSLDRALILAMEDEARWMIKNGLTAQKQIPDFSNYIYEDGLKAVRPGAVSMIH